MSTTFTCAQCGGVFPMGDDDEALAELERAWPGIKPQDCVLFCDDCYGEVKS
jgi:hypothetical protein